MQTAAVWGITHFLRVAALAHAHDLPVSPVGTTPVGLLHAAASVSDHIASEVQDLRPPSGIELDLEIDDGAFILGRAAGLGITIDETAIRASGGCRPEDSALAGPHVRPERAGQRILAEAAPSRAAVTTGRPAPEGTP